MQTFEKLLKKYQAKNKRLYSQSSNKLTELIEKRNSLQQEIQSLRDRARILNESRQEPHLTFYNNIITEITAKEHFLNVTNENLLDEQAKYEQYSKNKTTPKLSEIFEKTTYSIELKDIDFGELLFTDNYIKYNNLSIIIDKHCKFNNCNITSLKFENYSNLMEEQKYDLIFDNFHNKDENNPIIMINNSHFYGKFYINRKNLQETDFKERDIKIKSFYIKNSTFHQNFKLHNAEVIEFDINDSNFEDKADFFKTQFKKGKNKKSLISFYAINFNELSIFEECEFCEKVDFTYVTFKGLSQFRKATFKKGLNLDNTNIEKDMNFFEIQSIDSSASKEQTSQETYRIIKHQLEKQNNKIEANRYYSCELEKKRKNLASNLNCIENILSYIVFSLHNMTSAHARNWFLVLMWIFMTGLFTTLACDSEIPKIILPSLIISLFIFGLFRWTYFPIILALISSVILFKVYDVPFNIDEILQHTNLLFNIGKKNNFSSMLFANKIALGYLYYQFITSVRKDTSK
jgi:hypothetical protein